jgi:hypothetical protein
LKTFEYSVLNSLILVFLPQIKLHLTVSGLGYAVALLVEALRYKPEGCGFYSQ